MRIVGRDKLDTFCAKHATARKWIEAWLHETEGVFWNTPQDVKDRFATASFLADNTVVFNVKGNECRMEVRIAYKTMVVAVMWIGTHREYDDRNRQR